MENIWQIQRIQKIGRKLKKKIKYLRINYGGEYLSKKFQSYCKQEEIRRELTSAYCRQ